MGKVYEDIRENELTFTKSITDEEYDRAKEELDAEVFERHYKKVQREGFVYPSYYELIIEEVAEDEIDTYLLYELLKEQKRTSNHLREKKEYSPHSQRRPL